MAVGPLTRAGNLPHGVLNVDVSLTSKSSPALHAARQKATDGQPRLPQNISHTQRWHRAAITQTSQQSKSKLSKKYQRSGIGDNLVPQLNPMQTKPAATSPNTCNMTRLQETNHERSTTHPQPENIIGMLSQREIRRPSVQDSPKLWTHDPSDGALPLPFPAMAIFRFAKFLLLFVCLRWFP